MEKLLIYISAICWNDVNNLEEVTNVKDLQKNMYIEIPKDTFFSDGLYEYLNYKLKSSTDIEPWYYNLDYVCEI